MDAASPPASPGALPPPTERVATLPMYDFEGLRHAHRSLWGAIAEALAGVGLDPPAELAHGDDVHALWSSPSLFLSQSCGWPLVTELHERVSTIGTFAYDVPDAADGYYRSVLVAAADAEAADLGVAPAAVNSFASLSGWISLRAALGGDADSRPVVITGSHLGSLAALREGRAVLAAIDGVTHALVARDQPSLLDGIVTVGAGPLVPCLPIIGPKSWDAATVARVREAIGRAVVRPDLAGARSALRIERFVPLDASAYLPLLGLVAVRA